ncbi:MAG TPA: DUF6351 family protein, partial [Polyangiaceae bacterium]|nr:DUF6351 family protein [Polyangiaceae bacterium]
MKNYITRSAIEGAMAYFKNGYWLIVFASLSSLVHCSSSDSGGGANQDHPDGTSGSPEKNLVRVDYHTKKTPPLRAGEFDLVTLSTLPEAVTGGDVLIALRGLANDDDYTVARNGTDVTASLRRVGADVRGLVTGLRSGNNQLAATARGASGTRRAVLTVTNHAISGPVLSGPHQTPFICQTQAAGLGDPLDADCGIETRYEWYYRDARSQQYQKLDDPYAAYPAGITQTVTADGRAVPFVVRLETATINRGITRIAVLDDPQARGKDAPFDAAGWDQRVYYIFGESCGVGYHQGSNTPNYVLGGIPNSISSS